MNKIMQIYKHSIMVAEVIRYGARKTANNHLKAVCWRGNFKVTITDVLVVAWPVLHVDGEDVVACDTNGGHGCFESMKNTHWQTECSNVLCLLPTSVYVADDFMRKQISFYCCIPKHPWPLGSKVLLPKIWWI